VHDRRRSSTHGKRVPCISSYEKGDDSLSTHDPKRYYQTINLIEETGASEHSIRRYVRVLEETEEYPEIERDNRQNRLFNELDRMAVVEMVRLVKEEKKGVQDAAESVVLRLDEFKALLDVQETPSKANAVNEEINGPDGKSERLEYAITLLEHLLTNQKDLDERLKQIEAQHLQIETSTHTNEENEKSEAPSAEDSATELPQDQEDNEVIDAPQAHKKTGGFWARLFGRL